MMTCARIHIIRMLVLCLISIVCSNFIIAQQASTVYYMENVPNRHILNPAFQPLVHLYVSLPIIGFSQMNVSNNSITLNDIVKNENGTISYFYDSDDLKKDFFDALKSTAIFRTHSQTNLIAVGYKHKNIFLSFSVTEKFDATIVLPKNLPNLFLYLSPTFIGNSFDLTKLQTDFTAYSETAFGYAHRVSDQWSVGGKLKYLSGRANISNTNTKIVTDLSTDQWKFNIQGVANMSSPLEVNIGEKFQSISVITPSNFFDWLKPSGMGIGIDLGLDYRLTKNINLYASIIDLGFITWNKNTLNVDYSMDQSFSNYYYKRVLDKLIVKNEMFDSLKTILKNSKTESKTYTTKTRAQLNVGAEYTFPTNYFSVGLLSNTQFYNQIVATEITFSTNAKPNEWLNASLSYSIINGKMSTFGAGLGLKTGFVHWFISADYIPVFNSTLPLSHFGFTTPINVPIPLNSSSYNFSGGVAFVFDTPKRKTGLINKHTISKKNKKIFQPRSRNTYHLAWENPQTGSIR